MKVPGTNDLALTPEPVEPDAMAKPSPGFVPWLTAPIEDNQRLREVGHGFLPASFIQGFGESVTEGWRSAFLNPLSRLAEISAEKNLGEAESPLDEFGVLRSITDEPRKLSPMLTEDEWKSSSYFRKGLSFPGGVRERVAEIIAERHDAEMIRQDVRERAPGGIAKAGYFLGNLIGQMADPVNVGLAFIPIVREARYAGMVAKYGKTLARAGRGVAEGVTGAAIQEPMVYAANRQEQLDYTMADSIVNVAVGGVFGGGLHVGLGRLGDWVSTKLDANAKETILRTAIAQLAKGEDVNVEPVVKAFGGEVPKRGDFEILPEGFWQGPLYWGGQSFDKTKGGTFLSPNPDYAAKFASQTGGGVREVRVSPDARVYPDPIYWQDYQNIWRKDQMFKEYDAVRIIEPNAQGESLLILNPKVMTEPPPSPRVGVTVGYGEWYSFRSGYEKDIGGAVEHVGSVPLKPILDRIKAIPFDAGGEAAELKILSDALGVDVTDPHLIFRIGRRATLDDANAADAKGILSYFETIMDEEQPWGGTHGDQLMVFRAPEGWREKVKGDYEQIQGSRGGREGGTSIAAAPILDSTWAGTSLVPSHMTEAKGIPDLQALPSHTSPHIPSEGTDTTRKILPPSSKYSEEGALLSGATDIPIGTPPKGMITYGEGFVNAARVEAGMIQNMTEIDGLLALAESDRKGFKAALDDVATALKGRAIDDLKTRESVERKIVEKQSKGETGFQAEHVTDYLRGALIVDDPVAGMQPAMDRLEALGYQVVGRKDAFLNPNEWGYRGNYLDVKTPGGMITEVQIMTPEGFANWKRQHSIYEKWRDKAKGALTDEEQIALKRDLEESRRMGTEVIRVYEARKGAAVVKLASLPQHGSVVQGSAAKVLTPEGPVPVHYAVMEVEDIIPSHQGRKAFSKHPDYPQNLQEREYHSDKTEQLKTMGHADRYDPAYTITDNPDATNGPPIITPDRLVLGGNSRAMTLDILYGRGPEASAGYRETLRKKAVAFGLDPAAVGKMNHPVLVRVMDESPVDFKTSQKLVRLFNVPPTHGISAVAEGISRARLISPSTLTNMTDSLEQFGTLRQYLDSTSSRELISALVRDGAIDRGQLNRLLYPPGHRSAGLLTDEGKRLVEATIRGVVFPDTDLIARIQSASPATAAKLDKVLPFLAQLKEKGGGWDISDDLAKAVRLVGQWTGEKASGGHMKGGTSIAEWLNHPRLATEFLTDAARKLAIALGDSNPNAWKDAVESVAKSASRDERRGQGAFAFSQPPETPEQALKRVFGIESEAKRGGLFGGLPSAEVPTTPTDSIRLSQDVEAHHNAPKSAEDAVFSKEADEVLLEKPREPDAMSQVADEDIQRLDAAGRLSDADRASLAEADQAVADAASIWDQAIKAMASCIVRAA